MAKLVEIDTTNLTTIKSTETKNVHLKMLVLEIEAFNKLLKEKVRPLSKLVEFLDNAMVAAATWLTSKPKTGTDTNTKRHKAVYDIANQISWTFNECLGIRSLKGDFSKPGKPNEGNYWLERIDPKHRPGFGLLPQYDKWSNTKPADPHEYKTFWTYLDEVDKSVQAKAFELDKKLTLDPNLTGEDKAKLESEYKRLLALIDARAKNVEQLEANARVEYLRPIENGSLMTQDGKPFETKKMKTHFSGVGWAIFVVAMNNDIYANSHIKAEFHHSTFLAGAPVKCAGEIVVDNGKVVVLTAKSGHYQPKPEDLQKFCKFLQTHSVVPSHAMICASFGGQFQQINEFVNNGVAGKKLQADEVWKALPEFARSEEIKDLLVVYMTPDEHDKASASKLNGELRWGLKVKREGEFFLRVTEVEPKTPASRSKFMVDDLILHAQFIATHKTYSYRVRHADGTEASLDLSKTN